MELEVMSMGTEQISDKTEKQKRDGYRSFYNRVTKRVLDLVLALAGSVIVTPILLVIGIFIAIEDGFPIFYTPLRGGYHGKPFHIIKLRTMYKGADKLGGTTALNDPRITRAGRLLRKIKLDELPQLYNVLFGSMSWLSRIIYAESGAESMAGQIAVGNVILNRVRSSRFPDTVEGVIFDRKDAVQFEPVDNGRIYQTPSPQSVEAARRALDGERIVGAALYFYAPALSQGVWINANCAYQQTIGCHRFYV